MRTSTGVLKICLLAVAVALAGCEKQQTAVADPDAEVSFRVCAEAVTLLAKNPSTAKVPRVAAASRSQSKFRYEWNHGDGLSFTNGFGAAVDQTASCTTEGSLISMLSINGKPIPDQQLSLLRTNALVRVSKSMR